MLRWLEVLMLEPYLAVGTGVGVERLDVVGKRLVLKTVGRWLVLTLERMTGTGMGW